MKKIKTTLHTLLVLFGLSLFISGCSLVGLDLNEDYDYEKSILNEHVDMTAWDYLKSRSNGTSANDTVFRWMKKAIDYSGIDTTEYMKPNRTYIFLHNDAIRRVNSTQVLQNNCFFYDFPVMKRNPDGSLVLVNGVPQTSSPTKTWADYDKETVKKYLLYLIGQGEYNYNNLTPDEVQLQSLLPVNSYATTESRLGYMVTPSSIPGFTTASSGTVAIFDFKYSSLTAPMGFDPESKFSLKLSNTADSKVFLNGGLIVRSSGYYATNGSIHVWGTTVRPSR